MFRLEDVSKIYPQRDGEVAALRGATLQISPGEFVAVVGPSGSGKTTLLSILGGMLAPSDGKVWLGGQPLYDASPRERAKMRRDTIGFLFQTFNLIPYLSALENAEVPLMLSGPPTKDQQQRVLRVLERVGLESRLDHKPSELSIGQQQRVALARALANDPAVILADEPTGNLDPDTREQVLKFLRELTQEGRTVVMVTHDPAAAAMAARTIKLADGLVVADSVQRAMQAA